MSPVRTFAATTQVRCVNCEECFAVCFIHFFVLKVVWQSFLQSMVAVRLWFCVCLIPAPLSTRWRRRRLGRHSFARVCPLPQTSTRFIDRLIVAAAVRAPLEISNVLISSGANINARDSRGQTPLMVWVRFEDDVEDDDCFADGCAFGRNRACQTAA